MEVEKYIRKLAKSYKYQSISQGGENPTNCFVNKSDYTYYQIVFSSFLKFYNAINMDIAEEEIDEFVLSDTIYEDAYMYWRGKNKYKKVKEEVNKKFPSPINSKVPIKETQQLGSFRWDFKSKK